MYIHQMQGQNDRCFHQNRQPAAYCATGLLQLDGHLPGFLPSQVNRHNHVSLGYRRPARKVKILLEIHAVLPAFPFLVFRDFCTRREIRIHLTNLQLPR